MNFTWVVSIDVGVSVVNLTILKKTRLNVRKMRENKVTKISVK